MIKDEEVDKKILPGHPAFDFIIMASHHCGIISLEHYLDLFNDVEIMKSQGLDKPLDRNEIDQFLKANPHKICGLVLLSSDYARPNSLDILTAFTTPDTAILEISCDPLQKTLSFINTSIFILFMLFPFGYAKNFRFM